MTTSQTPFGIRFFGTTVMMKLRLSKEKFFKHKLDQHGSYRMTQSGYILFEAVLDTRDQEFTVVNGKLNLARQKPGNTPISIQPDEIELPF